MGPNLPNISYISVLVILNGRFRTYRIRFASGGSRAVAFALTLIFFSRKKKKDVLSEFVKQKRIKKKRFLKNRVVCACNQDAYALFIVDDCRGNGGEWKA